MNVNTPRPAPIARTTEASPNHIGEELRHYDAYLRDLRGLSSGSRILQLRVVGRFLHQTFGDGVVDVARLRPGDVRQFLADQLAARQTPSNASKLASGLRSDLRYRRACGDPVDALTAVISSPAHCRLASLPHALTTEEVAQLLDSFTFARRWPKRGYAIVRCALDLGLRASEIACLTISDIDWRAGTVTLRGTKSCRQDILPLPAETGQALADYLQHERPPTSHYVACNPESDHACLSTLRSGAFWSACPAPHLRVPAGGARQFPEGSRRSSAPPFPEHDTDLRQARYAQALHGAASMAWERIMSAHIRLKTRVADYLAERRRLGFELHSHDTLLADFA